MREINTPDGLFHDGNPATGELGTIVTAAWLNMLQAEVISVLADRGLTVDPAKSNQLLEAIKKIAWGGSGAARPTTLAGYGITDGVAVDAQGNIGLGVTPREWGGQFPVIQINGKSAIAADFNSTYYGTNWYRGTSGHKRLQDGFALQYWQDAAAGMHKWRTAPSAAAESAVDWTEAMSLDATLGVLKVAGGFMSTPKVITASTTLTMAHVGTILVNASAALALTFNLTGVPAGARWELKRVDSSANDVRLTAPAGKTFGGIESADIAMLYVDGLVEVVYDGSNLIVLRESNPHGCNLFGVRAGYLASPPRGVMMASGQAINSTDYPRLYALYGATVPDARGVVERYTDEGSGRVASGQQTIRSITGDAVGSHRHFSAGSQELQTQTGSNRWALSDQLVNLARQVDYTGGAETLVKNIHAKPWIQRG